MVWWNFLDALHLLSEWARFCLHVMWQRNNSGNPVDLSTYGHLDLGFSFRSQNNVTIFAPKLQYAVHYLQIHSCLVGESDVSVIMIGKCKSKEIKYSWQLYYILNLWCTNTQSYCFWGSLYLELKKTPTPWIWNVCLHYWVISPFSKCSRSRKTVYPWCELSWLLTQIRFMYM